MCVCVPCACVVEGFRFSGYCEQTHGCRELNLGPLESQPMPLTSEPTLQPHKLVFFNAGSHLCRPGSPQAQLTDTGLSLPHECWDFKLVLIIAGIETSPGHLQICTEFLRGTEFWRGGRENRILGGCPVEGLHLSDVSFASVGSRAEGAAVFHEVTREIRGSTLSFSHFYVLNQIPSSIVLLEI